MKTWLFQEHRQRQRLGDDAPWSVGWYDPEGKRRSKRIGAKSRAEKYARKVQAQLIEGTYQTGNGKGWDAFESDYEGKILAGMAPDTRETTLVALNHFTRLMKPKRMEAIKTQTLDDYIAKRRKERGRKAGSTVSAATINKELRHLKAALRIAHEWGYLRTVPKFRMVREAKKVPRYVTPEHFAAIYGSCDAAEFPAGVNHSAGDWWRALVVTAYMTGWRIGELLKLRRDHLDLDKGVAILGAASTKGKRGEHVPLHPVVVEHLQKIPGFTVTVFHLEGDRRALWDEFARIQKAAGIELPCGGDHEHNDACHRYGFHDLRRAFATMNADRLTADALQALMRHKSYQTTQRYINMARQLNRSVEGLHVPDVLRVAGA